VSDVTDFSEEDRERLYELTSIGASHAAMAFRMLLGRAIAPSVPLIREVDEYRAHDEWNTGVIFQADGELAGLVAILLPDASRDLIAEKWIREGGLEDPDEAAQSALRELGNIVASHTMSAIADQLGGRILLSVPLLVMEGADRKFASTMRQRGAERCVECELTDSAREVRVRLVFVPESKL
jgi:chemotaxis protein CheY-P-specific phosphatase CheC